VYLISFQTLVLNDQRLQNVMSKSLDAYGYLAGKMSPIVIAQVQTDIFPKPYRSRERGTMKIRMA